MGKNRAHGEGDGARLPGRPGELPSAVLEWFCSSSRVSAGGHWNQLQHWLWTQASLFCSLSCAGGLDRACFQCSQSARNLVLANLPHPHPPSIYWSVPPTANSLCAMGLTEL